MPLEFHCSSVQIVEDGGGASVVWIVDVKPDEIAGPLSEMMEAAAQSMAKDLA